MSHDWSVPTFHRLFRKYTQVFVLVLVKPVIAVHSSLNVIVFVEFVNDLQIVRSWVIKLKQQISENHVHVNRHYLARIMQIILHNVMFSKESLFKLWKFSVICVSRGVMEKSQCSETWISLRTTDIKPVRYALTPSLRRPCIHAIFFRTHAGQRVNTHSVFWQFCRKPCQHATCGCDKRWMTCIHAGVSRSPREHASVPPDKRHCRQGMSEWNGMSEWIFA